MALCSDMIYEIISSQSWRLICGNKMQKILKQQFVSVMQLKCVGLGSNMWSEMVSNLITAAHICRFYQITTVHECPGVLWGLTQANWQAQLAVHSNCCARGFCREKSFVVLLQSLLSLTEVKRCDQLHWIYLFYLTFKNPAGDSRKFRPPENNNSSNGLCNLLWIRTFSFGWSTLRIHSHLSLQNKRLLY